MKIFLFFMYFSLSTVLFAASPCDKDVHSNKGITISCKVIPGSGDSFLVLDITTNPGTTAISMVIGNPTFRKVVPLNVYPPFDGSHRFYVINLLGTTEVDYIIVEEHRLFNSAGFGS